MPVMNTNRLAQLEEELRRAPKHKRNRLAKSSSIARRAVFPRAFDTPVSYDVPPPVPVYAQPNNMLCWAAATTILHSWRDQQSLDMREAVRAIGPEWLSRFDNNHGIPIDRTAEYVAAAGLVAETPQSFSVEGWESLLRTFGPIWVGTDESLGVGQRFHIRIVIGMHGDGTAAGTHLTIIDPAAGNTHKERLSDFIKKYHEVVRELKGVTIQVVHLPADARRKTVAPTPSTQQSVGAKMRVLTDDELGDAEPPEPGVAQSFTSTAFARTAMTATDAKWAQDAVSPDYRHLGEPGLSQEFNFGAEHLKRLIELNNFDTSGGQDTVIFGLRGCQVINPSDSFAASIKLTEDIPDHQHNRCVLGVWRQRDDQLFLLQASTVPNWRFMEAYRQDEAKANLLPTGRYLYQVGTHRPTSSRPQPGAFKQVGKVVVLRTQDDLTYRVNDIWDKGWVGDNIHAGRLSVRDADFSSAGCQTVPGDYDNENEVPLADHSWQHFRKALGLNNSDTSKDDGTKFVYLLFTGRDARLVASGRGTELTRLRYGSNGHDVEALQQVLKESNLYKGRIDGDMGVGTTWAWVQWQKKNNGGVADAIVTPAVAQQLGFDMINKQSLMQGIAYGLGMHPWSKFFNFDKGTKYKVDGPWGYDGKGEVLGRTDSVLKFTLDMPEYNVPFIGVIPKANMIIDVTYSKEGAGNLATVDVNGDIYTDKNVTIKSNSAKNRRKIVPSISIPGINLQEISFSPDGKNEVDMDIKIDGETRDFDLERKQS